MNRQQLKQQLLDDPRRKSYIRGRVYWCEGQGHIEHQCVGGLEMNEVLVTRGTVRNIENSKKELIYHEINCSIVCSYFHTRWGHTRNFREWWHKVQVNRGYDVQSWLSNLPFKVTLKV